MLKKLCQNIFKVDQSENFGIGNSELILSYCEQLLCLSLIFTGVRPYLPGCQGQVTASDFLTCNNCNQCINTNFCDECQYWPIYPCYSSVRPMVDCVAEYVNDGISVNQVKSDYLKLLFPFFPLIVPYSIYIVMSVRLWNFKDGGS